MAHSLAPSKNPHTAKSPASSLSREWRTSAGDPTRADPDQPLLSRQWKYLWPQEPVAMRRGPDLIGIGWIDDITLDGTILWVQLNEGRGRMMIHQGDGIDIWRLNFRI
jgi:hypothetical protein